MLLYQNTLELERVTKIITFMIDSFKINYFSVLIHINNVYSNGGKRLNPSIGYNFNKGGG